MTTTTFSAPDIECDGCANAIKKTVGVLPGVSAIAVDIENKTVAVTHDETTTVEVITAVLDSAGFPASAV